MLDFPILLNVRGKTRWRGAGIDEVPAYNFWMNTTNYLHASKVEYENEKKLYT